MSRDALPLRQAAAWILLSVLFISVPAALGLGLYKYIRQVRNQDASYSIQYLALDPMGGRELPQKYLEQVLELSADEPRNLYLYSAKEAADRLAADPLIQEAFVEKQAPHTLIVRYRLREPIALLGDYHNTAIDREGIPFPYQPFFTDKSLPIFHLHNESSSRQRKIWGVSLNSQNFQMALQLLFSLKNLFPAGDMKICSIDVTKTQALSCGQRQIVVYLSEKQEDTQPALRYYLRLNRDANAQSLANYRTLRNYLQREGLQRKQIASTLGKAPALIVDLRLPHLAFISYKENEHDRIH